MESTKLRWALADNLGDDLFALSEGSTTRHSFLDPVISTIVAGLLLAFLIGLIDAKHAGQQVRAYIVRVLQTARRNDPADHSSMIEELDEGLDKFNQVEKDDRGPRLATAMQSLEVALREEGVSGPAAKRIAAAVCESVADAVNRIN